MSGRPLFQRSTEREDRCFQVDRFLAARGAGSGRLIFAFDATASRSPTWSLARDLSASMIREAASVGLDLQLAYFRGELKARRVRRQRLDVGRGAVGGDHGSGSSVAPGRPRSPGSWCTPSTEPSKQRSGRSSSSVTPASSRTTISTASAKRRLRSVSRTPVFAFQEGREGGVEKAFRKIAERSGGAYGRFEAGAGKQLGELLKAVALFAAALLRSGLRRQEETPEACCCSVK